MPEITGTTPRKPIVIELVGPAGSGKTTIAGLLARRSPGARPVRPPDPRAWRNTPFYLRNILASLPALAMAATGETEPGLGRDPFAAVVVLRGWQTRLRREITDGQAALLDQGPVYLLAELHGRGPSGLLRLHPWWAEMYKGWAETLTHVIRLDAHDGILVPRIRERDKLHRIKGATDTEARRYLAHWRGALDYTLCHLATHGSGPVALSYDTSEGSADELAERIGCDLGIA